MGIIIDLILVIIIGLNIFFGYKKGFIKITFSIFAFFIALIATVILVKPVSYLIIKHTQIDEKIKTSIIDNNYFIDYEQSDENTNQNETISDKNHNFIQKYIMNTITEKTNEAKNRALESTSEVISIKIVEIITAIVVFILIRIIIIILSLILDLISKIPIIKQFNKAGGIIYGLLKSLIIIYIILTIIFIIESVKGNSMISYAIDESIITKVLYNNNIVIKRVLPFK